MRKAALAQERLTLRSARAIAVTGTIDGKQVDMAPRCSACGRLLAEYAAVPYAFRCPRCKAEVKQA